MGGAVYIHDLGYALGELTETVETAVDAGRTLSDATVLRSAGFDRHHRCGPQTSVYELARRTVEAIGRSAVAGSSAIVHATCLTYNGNLGSWSAFEQSRDVKHLMDFPASHLQTEFGLDDAIAIGLNQQACTAMLGSIRIAAGLLATEPGFDKILCLTADRFPEGAIYEQSYNLISDGGAGWMVSREPRGFRLLASHHITNGALVMASDDESVGTYFNYTFRLIRECLARAGTSMTDVTWIVPQNMNVKAWQILARLLKIDFERVYFDPLASVAHVISGDPVINLKHLDDTGKLAPGDRLLMVMAGYGMNWQCTLVEKV